MRYAAAAFLLVIVGIFWFWRGGGDEFPAQLRVAGGETGGLYAEVAQLLSAEVSPHADSKLVALASKGTADNVARLEAGACEFALIQNDAVGGARVRTVAPLYDEVLHLIVSGPSKIESVSELDGRTVAIGAKGSGTATLAGRVLQHFELRPKAVHLPLGEAVAQLESGAIDAMFFVAGVGSAAGARALRIPGARLVGVAKDEPGSAADAFALGYPYVRPYRIPAACYGGDQPREAVMTLAIPAVLATHAGVSDDVVNAVTRALFARRAVLMRRQPILARLREPSSEDVLQFPVHPGADRYFHREAPGFLVEYAEAMGLVLSLMIALWGGITGLAQWRQRTKKNRIDRYYVDLERILRELRSSEPGVDRLDGIRSELVQLRHDAIEELVGERLLADESFRIFQAMLADCEGLVERRLKDA